MRIVKVEDLDESFFSFKEDTEIQIVRTILKDVKKRGDGAVREYTLRFDRKNLKRFEVTQSEIRDAYRKVDTKAMNALRQAAQRIRRFAKAQKRQFTGFTIKEQGITIGQRYVPIERVGCYVPGGRYPLPSSALMSIIPAKTAGVREIIVCSPNIKPVTLVAADLAGADQIFRIGGAQAIAAMAYGTETVQKVDIIVGPGNRYVTAAKREVFGIVGIDMLAGPSEVMIIADDSADPEFIAADLLAQAEHDPDAQVTLITDSESLAELVIVETDKQLRNLKTGDIARQSIANGMVVLVENLGQAIIVANRKAPEHLELMVKKPNRMTDKLKNYGSLFIGEYSAEAFGDYCSGTNHILPTNGAARYTGGLSVGTFLKRLTYQKIDRTGAASLSKTATTLAEVEGLDGHRLAALKRKP